MSDVTLDEEQIRSMADSYEQAAVQREDMAELALEKYDEENAVRWQCRHLGYADGMRMAKEWLMSVFDDEEGDDGE